MKTKYVAPPNSTPLLALQALGALNALERRYAPQTLWAAGNLELLRAPWRVAIVGSRDASPEGRKRASKLAAELAAAGVVVVSGLAVGIDTAAHIGAMRAGGQTIAVLGTPLQRCYPAENAELQMEIYRHHLLVSQFAASQRTYPSDFVKRNRTMALLSHASVIVEARDGSGALSQAAETQRLERPLFFMKSVLENRELQWPARFAESGATVLRNTHQILEELSVRSTGT